jgi:DNA-binding NtrC family response regulator
MPTRKELSADTILVALRASDEDVDEAGKLLGVTPRTLQRRMAELGIRARIRYELEAAA